MLEKQFLSTSEAAKLMGMSVSHLYVLARRGTIPSHRPWGRKLVFDRNELTKLIKEK